jgi:hypothetical protein
MGIGAGAALAAALATYAGARIANVPLLVDGPSGTTEVPVGAVVMATAIGAVAAWVVSRGALRTARPRVVFVGVVGPGLVLSSVPPMTGATSGSTAGWLLLMHLVVAVPLITAGWRLLPTPAGAER